MTPFSRFVFRKYDWQNYLHTPTEVVKFPFDKNYFIVDCWHHRVIYSPSLRKPIGRWRTLTEVLGGHTVASDGEVYLCDDTDSDAIQVFVKDGAGYRKVQHITLHDKIGGTACYYDASRRLPRPHYICYDAQSRKFLCAISWGGGY